MSGSSDIQLPESFRVEISAYLKALTPEAKTALGNSFLKIDHFPYRVGRDSRGTGRPAETLKSRPRLSESRPNNDLYLNETGAILNVSREHFLIDCRDGEYVLVDRGSSCGTLVEGERVGEKHTGGWRRLQNNDVIIVGASDSKFVFKFVVVETS